jgi:hypothetical protein
MTGSSLPARASSVRSRAIFLQRVIGVLGGRRIGSAALAQIVDSFVEVLRRDAGILQRGCRRRAGAHADGLQQPFSRHERVAGLLCEILDLFEDSRGFGREIDLPAAPLDLRQFAERQFHLLAYFSGPAAGRLDQVGRHALLIVEEHLQNMFGVKS